jgi:hypothetical protein
MVTKIYSLHESDGTLRYIGKTKNELIYRLDQHIRETKSHKNDFSYRCNWFRKMIRLGCIPSIKLIEEVEGDGVIEERYWIKHYRDLNYRLVNTTEGGEGLYNPSKEVRERIASKHIGMKASLETKQKMSLSRTGKHHSNGRLGHKHSEETKKKIGAGNKGKKMSKQACEKLSVIRKNYWMKLRQEKVS